MTNTAKHVYYYNLRGTGSAAAHRQTTTALPDSNIGDAYCTFISIPGLEIDRVVNCSGFGCCGCTDARRAASKSH